MNKENMKKGMLLRKEKEAEVSIYRVLELVEEKILVIDCVKKTMPVWKDYHKFADYVEVEEEIKKDSVQDFDILEDYDANIRKIIYQRFNMISAILPFVSDEVMRSEVIKKVAEEYEISKQTIRKHLCEYLATQDLRSLAPQERITDKPLTKDEKNFRKALNKYYYTSKKRTLKNVYTLMLRDSYCDSEGKLVDEYPSFYKFRYFFRKHNTKQEELISREGLSAYQRNFRPLVGDGVRSFAPNVGVGMLDSTVCDIYLINNSGGIVGRPILTACVDAYSGLCMGYSLGWEGGTYSLRDMILNVVSDKVEHCKLFGIKISKKDWDCSRLPGKLLTDKGSEYKGSNFEQITDLGVQLVNLPAFRPELKGPVEKFFDCVQGYYRNQLKGKGVVEPDFQERGVHDYRKDACLTLEQFEAILLHCILFYNSQRVVENFPYTEEMLELGVKPYANEIWNYGCEQIGYNLIKVSKEQIVFTLLPRATGRFTRQGLSANGMHYHNEDRRYRELYLQGNECEIAYNPDNVGCVWLIEKGHYISFELIESRFKNKDLTDVQDMKQRQKKLVKLEQDNKTQAEIDLIEHIQTIANTTVGITEPSVKNIRDNREKEIGRTHKDFIRSVVTNG